MALNLLLLLHVAAAAAPSWPRVSVLNFGAVGKNATRILIGTGLEISGVTMGSSVSGGVEDVTPIGFAAACGLASDSGTTFSSLASNGVGTTRW